MGAREDLAAAQARGPLADLVPGVCLVLGLDGALLTTACARPSPQLATPRQELVTCEGCLAYLASPATPPSPTEDPP